MSYSIGDEVKLVFETPRSEEKSVVGEVVSVELRRMKVETSGNDPNFVYHSSGRVDMCNEKIGAYSAGIGSNAEVKSAGDV